MNFIKTLLKIVPGKTGLNIVKFLASRPINYTPKQEEKEFLARGKLIEFEKNKFAWSYGQGPLVIFIHGWGGAAAQFFQMEHSVSDLGFTSITFDVTGLDLIEERIDISVRLGSLQDSSYIGRRLSKMKFYICASPDYIEKHGRPAKPEEIREHNCLIFLRTGNITNWLFKDKKEKVLKISIGKQCLITNSQAVKQCTISGMGLALLPDWLVREDITSGKLISLFDKFTVTATDFDSCVYLLYPSREYVPLKTQVFIDHLIENTHKKRL